MSRNKIPIKIVHPPPTPSASELDLTTGNYVGVTLYVVSLQGFLSLRFGKPSCAMTAFAAPSPIVSYGPRAFCLLPYR